MAKNLLNVIVDTNVLISAILFGGKPRQIVTLILEGKISAFISPVLLAELVEILSKKFQFSADKIALVQEALKENFVLVYPSREIHVVRDEDDNRVLEAAVKGECGYIVTGDRDLLELGEFEGIRVVSPEVFLSSVSM